MVETEVKVEFGSRLEDFITLAQKGRSIQVKVELKKKMLKQKVHPEETDDQSSELDTYLLIADYSFEIKGEGNMQELFPYVSKTYMFATVEESLNSHRVNTNIANARLKMDYDRLKAANIHFEEKFF